MASRTQHFKSFSIVDGDVKVNMSLARFEKQFQRAQFAFDSKIMMDMLPFIPRQSGTFVSLTLAQSAALAGTGTVVAAAGPMGRFLYEGKVMVDEVTGSPIARPAAKKVLVSQYSGKTNAKENLSYGNPQTVPHWFDEAKRLYSKKWIDLVKKTAGGG